MSISISVEAAKRIIKNLEEEGSAEGGLRLGVKGGGCAGLSYVMRYDSEKQPNDKVFEEHGARIFVDLKSYLFLKGMTLEWKEQLMQQGFDFVNPNATKTCSCGLSFGF
ncbi:MAG: iron-sulfur cluster assembly accessory protein [Acidobacteriota bacterium]|nr:iron-sulfur cluster assembly accessory protein [Acidobacteriota bacterium]